MGFFVNPMKRKQEASAVPAQEERGSKRVKEVAGKVSEMAQIPVVGREGIRGKDVQLLSDATQLAKRIRRSWNELTPPELAEQIIELEARVVQLKGASLEEEKIRKVAQHLHFQFVFPMALELDADPTHGLFSFAREVYEVAKQVFKNQSMHLFYRLNSIQQHETLRYAMGGVA